MTRPMPGLKLITLNTDLWYIRNFYTMLDTDQDDPSGLFHDLILELQDSEDKKERGMLPRSGKKKKKKLVVPLSGSSCCTGYQL